MERYIFNNNNNNKGRERKKAGEEGMGRDELRDGEPRGKEK